MGKNVIIALNNKIREKLKDDSLNIYQNVNTQEDLFNKLQNLKQGHLITCEGLTGYHSKFSFVKQLRDINTKIEITFISEMPDKEFEDYAKGKNVNIILSNSEIKIENITRIINEFTIKSTTSKIKADTDLTIFKPQQQIVVVTGTEGAGKSTVIAHLATHFARQSTAKILLIDLDTANGGLNNFFNLKLPSDESADKNSSSLSYIVDSINKKTFSYEIFEKFLIKNKKLKNLYLLTGNTSFYLCKSVLSEIYYTNIIETAKSLFDYIFIDTSSNIFLDSTQFAINNSNQIFFICNANLISTERSLKLFNEIYDAWGVDKEKIKIIINKYHKDSLEKEIMKEVFKNYKIGGFLPYDSQYEKSLNEGKIKIPKKALNLYNKILDYKIS